MHKLATYNVPNPIPLKTPAVTILAVLGTPAIPNEATTTTNKTIKKLATVKSYKPAVEIKETIIHACAGVQAVNPIVVS